MKALIISGNTLQETNWNVEDILTDMPQTTKDVKERMEFQEQYLKRQDFFYNQSLQLTDR
jgi:dolichyl-phosphate-mannose--protein O-mannosyl transferase